MMNLRPPQLPSASLLALLLPLWAAGLANAADVSAYGVGKAQRFLQTNDTPQELVENPWAFTAIVQMSASNNVLGARVQSPPPVTSVDLTNSGLQFTYARFFSNKLSLDAAFPNGVYTNRLTNVHDGLKVIPLNLNADLYPSIPRIANLADGQQIDHSADFTVLWDAINPGAAFTPVQIVIRDGAGNVVVKSPDLGQPGALDYNATEFVITNFTLQPGTVYDGTLVIISMSQVDPGSVSTYPGVNGFAGYSRETTFSLRTLGAVPAPTLGLSIVSNVAKLNFSTEVGRTYTLQAATVLTNWIDLLVTNAASNSVSFTESNSAPTGRIYRVRSP